MDKKKRNNYSLGSSVQKRDRKHIQIVLRVVLGKLFVRQPPDSVVVYFSRGGFGKGGFGGEVEQAAAGEVTDLSARIFHR